MAAAAFQLLILHCKAALIRMTGVVWQLACNSGSFVLGGVSWHLFMRSCSIAWQLCIYLVGERTGVVVSMAQSAHGGCLGTDVIDGL